MNGREKTVWLSTALFFALWLLAGHAFLAFLPGPNAEYGRTFFAQATLYGTVAYLLVLSWRGAYLAGRKRS